jgi:ankyrin repeat protein
VEYLLANGAQVNGRDGFGDTPLHKAINYGQPAIIDLMLARGADVTSQDASGRPPLTLSLANTTGRIDEATRTEMAVVLIDYGAPIGARDNQGRTLLQHAVQKGSTGTVKLLLEYGASADNPYPDKRTPLNVAIADGNLGMVRLLLEHGAAVDRPAPDGDPPIHSAIRAGNFKLVILLIEEGAKTNSIPNSLREALRKPQGRDEELFIHAAVSSRSLKAIEFALSLGQSITATTGGDRIGGRTPLHIAARWNCVDEARFLLERGAPVDVHEGNSHTPLGLAAESGSKTMVALLLEYGADPNVQAGEAEWSALHMVAYGPGWMMPRDEEARMAVVRLLLDAGADKTLTDYSGATAYDVSVEKRDKKVPELLAL